MQSTLLDSKDRGIGSKAPPFWASRAIELFAYGWVGLLLVACPQTAQEVCSFGQRRCSKTPFVMEVCTSSGEWAQESCPTQTSCQEGFCRPFQAEDEILDHNETSSLDAATLDTALSERPVPSDASFDATIPPDFAGNCTGQDARCLDAATRVFCDGGRLTEQTCQTGTICRDGQCSQTTACQDGSRRCLDLQRYELCENKVWKPMACPSGQTCQFGLCSPQSTTCTDGAQRCVDARSFQRCQGQVWQSSEACPSGQSCANDRCQGSAPFQCSLPSANPSIVSRFWQHPKDPYAGQTITLSLQSDTVKVEQAPPLSLEIINRSGSRTITQSTIIGGKTLYYLSAAGLTAGENCLIVRQKGGRVELATKVIARDPGAGIPRKNGVWKITRHHQWTCSEQPTYGNFLVAFVRDEQGSPIEGANVLINWTDDTVVPIKPSSDAHTKHPRSMLTDKNGRAELWTPWGQGIRSPIDGKPGWLVFLVSVDGGASDVATEITSGIWEDYRQADGSVCNFCSKYGVNVYGHWSYTIEFRRDPNAKEICDVPSNHEGQKRCTAYPHAYHEVGRPSCVPVAP